MTAPIVTRPTLTAAGATLLVDTATRLASEAGLTLCIAVVDPAGHLLAFHRMDGAPLVTIDGAIGKARTAALLQSPSRAFEERIDAGAPSLITVPGLVSLQGGIPVWVGDEIVGAIGTSGGTGDEDEDVAERAVGEALPTDRTP